MGDREAKIAEVEKNFEAFQALLPAIEPVHAGQFALMHDGKIVEYFDSIADAVKYGQALYPEGLFSLQEVTSRVIDLGYFSHACAH